MTRLERFAATESHRLRDAMRDSHIELSRANFHALSQIFNPADLNGKNSNSTLGVLRAALRADMKATANFNQYFARASEQAIFRFRSASGDLEKNLARLSNPGKPTSSDDAS